MNWLNQLISSKKTLYIGGALFLIVLLLAIFGPRQENQTVTDEITPAKIEVKTEISPNPIIKEVSNINIAVQESLLEYIPKELPESLPVYQYTEPTFVNEANISNMAKLFKFGETRVHESPIQGPALIASNQNGSIIAEIENHKFSLVINKSLESTDDFKNKDPKIFVDASKKFLASLDIDINKYPETKYAYLSFTGSHMKITDTPDGAKKIEIIFISKTPNNYPLIDKNLSVKPNQITVLLDADGDILEMSFEDFGSIGKSTTALKIKSKETLIKDLKEGKAQLINIDSSGQVNTSIATLIKKISLVYTVYENKLTPVFIAEGTASLTGSSENKQAKIEFLIEAEATE